MDRAAIRTQRHLEQPWPLVLLAFVVAHQFLTRFTIWLDDPVYLGGAFWPAAGLSLAALISVPNHRWPSLLGVIAFSEAITYATGDSPMIAGVLGTSGNVIAPFVGALLLRRLGDRRGRLVPVRNLGAFLITAVLLGPVVGAGIGALGTAVAHDTPWLDVWPRYLLGDLVGVLVIAPLLLSRREPATHRRGIETVALTAGTASAFVLVFATHMDGWDTTIPYLLTPFLLWAALRYEIKGAAVSVAAIATGSIWATTTGHGPFAAAADQADQSVLLLQIFLLVSAVTTFVLAALVEDLTERDEVERGLERQATHDPLTGLPNRVQLDRELGVALLATREHGRRVAVLMCDLDDFKVVNDGLGHQAGDQLLVEVGRRMRSCLRPDDLVVHLSGDEFVVLLRQADDDIVDAIAGRILQTVPQPVMLDDHGEVVPSISIGVAMGAHDDSPGSLLRDADTALYRAKDLGKARMCRFDATLRAKVADRLFLERGLRSALTDDQLFCVYQPEIELSTGRVFGYEALARWQHPTDGLIMPDRFVPVVEATGNATALFERVLVEALEDQRRWTTKLGFRPNIAVNVSARQLGDERLVTSVAMALARTNTPADSLWLEVTETAAADATTFDSLVQLHDLGVRLAIDDFGAGYSSMARLSLLPWDILKIDRAFVSPLGTDPLADHLVRAMIALAHSLGIRTVAEGVETTLQLDHLVALGCDVVQGYLFSKPTRAREAIDHVRPDGVWSGATVDRVDDRLPGIVVDLRLVSDGVGR